MVKFGVEKRSALGRLGKIAQWGDHQLDHATPSCMIYTRGGHVPHLTWDVASKWLRLAQQPIYQLTLPSIIESHDVVKAFGRGAPAFCAMPSTSPVHMTVFDPLSPLKTGYNDTKSVAVWTKGGKKSIDAALMREIVASYQCDSFESLVDYDTPREAKNKRLTKAVDRTSSFYEQMFNGPEPAEGAVLISLGGGFSLYHRRKCALDLGMQARCCGYSIDLHEFSGEVEVDEDELRAIVNETFEPLPVDRLRHVTGCFSPAMVHKLVSLGIDLFDSSYAVMAAEKACAVRLADDYPTSGHFQLLDFNDAKYADDFVTPFEDCECYTCKNYTKGYLHHLNNTKELLASLLLVIHNVHEYQRAFELLRTEIGKQDAI